MFRTAVSLDLLEYYTDALMGCADFHAVLDTIGDILFDAAGVITAALLISRHDVNAMRCPFWHSHLGIEEKAAGKA